MPQVRFMALLVAVEIPELFRSQAGYQAHYSNPNLRKIRFYLVGKTLILSGLRLKKARRPSERKQKSIKSNSLKIERFDVHARHAFSV